MKLKYIPITRENLSYATKIQNQIFKEESAYEHYRWTIEQNCEYQKYYLVYDENEIIGITGHYSNEPIEKTHSLWLGWYGVLEEKRLKGYGKKILLDTISLVNNLSNKYPIKYFRLYTDKKENKEALKLYDTVFELKEAYNNKNDINYDGNCIIYSKSLITDTVPRWNNKFLNLKEIIEEQGGI